jgi:hypothetical protein
MNQDAEITDVNISGLSTNILLAVQKGQLMGSKFLTYSARDESNCNHSLVSYVQSNNQPTPTECVIYKTIDTALFTPLRKITNTVTDVQVKIGF